MKMGKVLAVSAVSGILMGVVAGCGGDKAAAAPAADPATTSGEKKSCGADGKSGCGGSAGGAAGAASGSTTAAPANSTAAPSGEKKSCGGAGGATTTPKK